jgi:hypothetical protein
MIIGTHHRAPVVEIMEENGFMEKEIQAEACFSRVRRSPGAPDAIDEGEHPHFSERIMALHHLPAYFLPKAPVEQLSFNRLGVSCNYRNDLFDKITEQEACIVVKQRYPLSCNLEEAAKRLCVE